MYHFYMIAKYRSLNKFHIQFALKKQKKIKITFNSERIRKAKPCPLTQIAQRIFTIPSLFVSKSCRLDIYINGY